MLFEDRVIEIMKYIKRDGSVTTKKLMEDLNTSESTIRRDLVELEKIGKLTRVHGGAIRRRVHSEEESLDDKFLLNKSSKEKIAKKAADLVKDGDSIYLDGGSTTFEMIKYLKGKDITVVTNGIYHISELMKNNIKAYVLGGYIKKVTGVVLGAQSFENISQFSFDYAFMGANGIDIKKGYTTSDLEEAKLKRQAMALGQEVYILADKSKFRKVYFVKIADLEDGKIITDESIENIPEEISDKTEILEV